MRFTASVLALLLALPHPTGASGVAEPAPLYASGGTSTGTGAFYPGTAVQDGDEIQGVPYRIERGQDLLLTNLDEPSVAICHRIVSSATRRNGKPLFSSGSVCDPLETTLVRTAKLRPGTYAFVCTVHSRMWGLIEVVTQ